MADLEAFFNPLRLSVAHVAKCSHVAVMITSQQNLALLLAVSFPESGIVAPITQITPGLQPTSQLQEITI